MNPQMPINVERLWSSVTNRDAKEQIANDLVGRATDGEVIGFGSGTTSMVCALAFGEAVKSGLNISAVVTSYELQWLCMKLTIPVLSISDTHIDWCFDGADEVDTQGNLLKGRGGAMHRERQVFDKAQQRIVVADSTKDVSVLGEKFPAPVEVNPEYAVEVIAALKEMDFESLLLRTGQGKDGPIITESGNVIVDIVNRSGFTVEAAQAIHSLDGVVDTGLFMEYKYERIL